MFIKGHSSPNFFLVKPSALETCMYFSEACGEMENRETRQYDPSGKS